MKTGKTINYRKKLVRKMETVFSEKIHNLTPELQTILLDDLVTAFENRLDALRKTQLNLVCLPITTEDVKCETI